MKTLFNLILGISFILTIASCKKAGIGGNNTIAAFPRHHGKSIPGAMIYIKYNAKEFPGEDLSVYDDALMAKKEGSGDAHAHFEELKKGNYYLYAVGFDSSIAQTVKGGIGAELKKKEGETDVEIPVVE